MNDKFLHDQRREPRPEFAHALRERLRAQGPATAAARASHMARRLRPALAVAAAMAVVAAIVLSPSLRTYAQAFLDLFRVRNFVAVSVDPDRFAKLGGQDLDLKKMLGNDIESLEEPGKPQVFFDTAAAGQAAGFRLRIPTTVPNGLAVDTVLVTGASAARVTVDATAVREALQLLGITDLRVPDNVDGAQVTVRTSPAVAMDYRREGLHVTLVQSPSPEVSAPTGLDLAQLGEIGLRIAGLDPVDARNLARRIDWRSTLVVPVPMNASSFREVDLGNATGLLISTQGHVVAPRGAPSRKIPRGNMLLWSDNGMVYGLIGNLRSRDLVQMASTLQ